MSNSAPGPDATPPTEENLGENIYRVLWERILDRRLRPGDKLSDLRLSAELGVSRTPVREALQRLVRDGIVRSERHRGFTVASFSEQDVREIYELRIILETGALRLAMPNLDRAVLLQAQADLDRILTRMRSVTSRRAELEAASAFLELDRAFHRWLVERAANRRLQEMTTSLWGQIAVFQKAGSYVPARIEASIASHQAIITALLANDEAAAVGALTHHIQDAKRFVIADLTERGVTATSPASTERNPS